MTVLTAQATVRHRATNRQYGSEPSAQRQTEEELIRRFRGETNDPDALRQLEPASELPLRS